MTVETDRLRRTKTLQAGSGFVSQHSKELLFGLGASQRAAKVEVRWPSGGVDTLTDVPLGRRVWIEEARGIVRSEAFAPKSTPASTTVPATTVAEPRDGTWLYRPVPAPDFTLADLEGHEHSLGGLRGRPTLLIFWSLSAPPSRQALSDLARQRAELEAAGVTLLALAVDPASDEAKVRAAAQGLGIPVMLAGQDVAGMYSILSRHLFDRREELRLPTAFLLDGQGDVVRLYRDQIVVSQVLADIPKIDVPAAERLARAVPFPGTFYQSPGDRNYFPYSLDLAEQGFEAPAVVGFERAAQLDPSAITFYNLGTLYVGRGRPTEARAAFERALEMRPGYAEASNSLGALLAQSDEVPAAIQRFREALRAKPDFADAMNNLGYALFQMGEDQEAFELYQKALDLQPEFPEACNNLGIYFGQQGNLARAEQYFRQAVEKRPAYGEAANNLAMVVAARGDAAAAIALLEQLLAQNPTFEMTYVTLARIYLGEGRQREGMQVLERLLQRNPAHPLGLQLLRQIRG